MGMCIINTNESSEFLGELLGNLEGYQSYLNRVDSCGFICGKTQPGAGFFLSTETRSYVDVETDSVK